MNKRQYLVHKSGFGDTTRVAFLEGDGVFLKFGNSSYKQCRNKGINTVWALTSWKKISPLEALALCNCKRSGYLRRVKMLADYYNW